MTDQGAAVRNAVVARRAVDARERESIDRFVELFEGLERPFDEHADRVHVTASAIVVTEDRSRVVLHRHKRLGLWLQPGGHIEQDESPWDGARREAAEETGLPVTLASPDLIHVDVHPGPRGHTHLDLRYLVTSPLTTPAPAAGESQDVQWFQWHRAIEVADPGLSGALRALQPGTPRVRPARRTDASGIADVYLRSRRFALPSVAVVHDDAEVRRWVADEVVGRLDCWVAEVDGTVVAILVLDRHRGRGWVEQFYVDPAWIGRGLGEELLGVARDRCPEGLDLWSFQVNEPALRFYRRHGFSEVERTDGTGNEERAPDVHLRWTP